jgi:hypothetical protein
MKILISIYTTPFRILNAIIFLIFALIVIFIIKDRKFKSDIFNIPKNKNLEERKYIVENIFVKYPVVESYFWDFSKNIYNKLIISTFIYYTIFCIYVR